MKLSKYFAVFILLSIVSTTFFAGYFYALVEPGGNVRSQVLVFAVKQNVSVQWLYDEAQVVPIDDTNNTATVRLLSLASNRPSRYCLLIILKHCKHRAC
ncbi:MAG: hypothetical protein ACP5KD_04100 [Fervidobacterium sp.]